jgi:hypothetical protein
MTSQTPASDWPQFNNSPAEQLRKHLATMSDGQLSRIAVEARVQSDFVVEFAAGTGTWEPSPAVLSRLAAASGFKHPADDIPRS